jgi:hypothetical protein
MTRRSGTDHDGALGGSHAPALTLLRRPPSTSRLSFDQDRRRKSRQKPHE